MTKSIQARSCAGTREKRRKLSKVACALFIYIETLYGWVLSINVLHPQKMPCGKANCPHKCVKLEAFFFFFACLFDYRARPGDRCRYWCRSTVPCVQKSQKWTAHVMAYPCATRMFLCCLDVKPLATCRDLRAIRAAGAYGILHWKSWWGESHGQIKKFFLVILMI